MSRAGQKPSPRPDAADKEFHNQEVAAMAPRHYQSVFFVTFFFLVLMVSPSIQAASETEGPPRGHKKTTGVVMQKAGSLAVKGGDGATYQVNLNAGERHGHAAFKEGDEVSVFLDENNAVIDMHPKGQEGKHRFVTGKLKYVGLMKKQIKLVTPDGEKVFPIERLEIKTGGIEEGSLVTAELNEAGTLIDLHRADSGGDKH